MKRKLDSIDPNFEVNYESNSSSSHDQSEQGYFENNFNRESEGFTDNIFDNVQMYNSESEESNSVQFFSEIDDNSSNEVRSDSNGDVECFSITVNRKREGMIHFPVKLMRILPMMFELIQMEM